MSYNKPNLIFIQLFESNKSFSLLDLLLIQYFNNFIQIY
jgi:hypothetical protein